MLARVLLGAALPTGRALAATPASPLGATTPGTLRALFLDMPPADARAVVAPELDLRWTLANDWSTPTVLFRGGRTVALQTDEQADSLALSARLPWAGRLATALELRVTEHWGGWSDRPIERWHQIWDYTGFYRADYPRSQVHLLLAEPGRPALMALESPRLALGDAAVRTQLLLAQGGEAFRAEDAPSAAWGVSVRLDVKVPLGRLASAGGSGGWDAGLALLGTAELAPWLTGHAMLALSAWSGLPAGFPLQPRVWHGSADASLAFRLGEWVILLEDRFLSPAFEGGWALAGGQAPDRQAASAAYATLRPHNQITVGLRHGSFSIWLSEDMTPGRDAGSGAGNWFYDSNAPDVVLGLAFTHRI